MLSEKEVKILLLRAQQSKYNAKSHGTTESYRVACKAEKLLKRILEIEPEGKIDRRLKKTK